MIGLLTTLSLTGFQVAVVKRTSTNLKTNLNQDTYHLFGGNISDRISN